MSFSFTSSYDCGSDYKKEHVPLRVASIAPNRREHPFALKGYEPGVYRVDYPVYQSIKSEIFMSFRALSIAIYDVLAKAPYMKITRATCLASRFFQNAYSIAVAFS